MPVKRSPSIIALADIAAGAPVTALASNTSDWIAKTYPKESLAMGEQGLVGFAVELDADARIDTCVVTKSSGYRRLDRATCDLIVTHAHFAPAESDGKRVATIRNGHINWRLPGEFRQNAALARPPAPITATELEADRLICTSSNAIGSLIKVTTFCLTKTEWAQARKEGQRQAEKFINPSYSNHGCHYVGPRC